MVDKLNPLDRYLFLYLLTNERTNISGIYELSQTVACRETGIDKETIPIMFRTLEPKVYYFDGWVIMPNFPKNQNQNSPKVKIGIFNELQQIPKKVLEYAISIGYVYHIDTLSHLNLNLNLNSNLNSNLSLVRGERDLFDPRTGKKPTTPRGFLDAQRIKAGKPPMRRKISPKQQETMKELMQVDDVIKKHRAMAEEETGADYSFMDEDKNPQIRSLIALMIPKVENKGKTTDDFLKFLRHNSFAREKNFNPLLCYTEAMLVHFFIGGKERKGGVDL